MSDYLDLIRRHALEIKPEYSYDRTVLTWHVFPMRTGGHWSSGATMEEAIDRCVESNRLGTPMEGPRGLILAAIGIKRE